MVHPDLKITLRDLIAGRLPWPLYLHGAVGTGKTLSMLALTDIVVGARFWTMSELMERAWNRWEMPWDGVWGWPHGPRLAILDELGVSPREAGKLEYDTLLAFADWRDHGPAIYISNHGPKMIERLYDERIWSRLMCGTIHFLEDVDRRLFTPEWLKEASE